MLNFYTTLIHDKLMIMIRFFLSLIILAISVPVHAQNFSNELSERDYTAIISKALRYDKATDFSYLRSLYTQMVFYQPDSDLLMKELLTHSARVQMAASTASTQGGLKAYEEELQTYTDFISMHVGHPDVMWMASILAKDDPTLGNPEMYTWIYDNLKSQILEFGDGESPEGAYQIATWGEETLIFGALGVQRLTTEPINEGFMRYNMHSVYDPKTDSTSTLFINTTYPQKFRDKNTSNGSSRLDFSSFFDHSLKATPQGESQVKSRQPTTR